MDKHGQQARPILKIKNHFMCNFFEPNFSTTFEINLECVGLFWSCELSVFKNFRYLLNMEKLEQIKQLLLKDHLATDIKLSIFNSAALSFKQDSLLTPFPKFYLNGGVKDFEKLVESYFESSSDQYFRIIVSGLGSQQNAKCGRVFGPAYERKFICAA